MTRPTLLSYATPAMMAISALLLTASGGCVHTQPLPPLGTPVTIQIDAAAQRHPISPFVYGVSYAEENATALNCPINRYGGNNASRYNWRLNADNRAQDWFFQSIADDDPTPGGRIVKFVKSNNAQGHTPSMVTIPLTGWVAKVNPDRSKQWSFSVKKYGHQQKIDEQWTTDAGNGVKPDGSNLTGNDPNDANVTADAAFMRPWIESLTKTFGTAAKGGVGYYLLDNEPGLWHGTHRDVWPTGIKMDDLFQRSREMAQMVKQTDATAQVVGPEEWGWTGFLYSGYDSQWGSKNGYRNLPDRAAHGDKDFVAWYLQQWAQTEKTSGKRLLDVFSLHFYPQGGEFSGATDEAMQLRRNRSTRALWDPNYTDETWINNKVRLIPRMKEWVAQNYPGTKTALTEYSWGGDGHINGATAQADIFGILGREGLDIGARWTCPNPKTPTFKAMQMYRNYDGKKGTFGNTSVACAAPFPDSVAAFAAQDSATGILTVMIIAKTPGTAASPKTPVRLNLAHFTPGKAARCYQLTAKNKIEHLPDVLCARTQVSLSVPAQSITLLVIPPR